MNTQEKTIKSMIDSPDPESRYMAVQILRKDDKFLTKHFKQTMIAEISLKDKIRDYSDICEELGEKELTLEDFIHFPEISRRKLLACAKLNQITRCVNGEWIPNFKDLNQYKWYPYFEYKRGVGLVFLFSRPLLTASTARSPCLRMKKLQTL